MIANVFSGGTLDRASNLRRDDAALADHWRRPESQYYPVWRSQNLVRVTADGFAAATMPGGSEIAPQQIVFLGLSDGRAHFAVDISSEAAASFPGLGEFADLRPLGAQMPRADAALLAYARSILHWHRTHRFCGCCGAASESQQGGHLRICVNPDCATHHFPRTDLAVIMLVWSGDHCLLGRQAIWPPGKMSTLAGFVEPGETPEEAVVREVLEETGVMVADIRYHSSQPWPFPGSLMIGFTAEASGRIDPKVDRDELESAAWFSRQDIKNFAATGHSLPGKQSIARRLIEDWLAQ